MAKWLINPEVLNRYDDNISKRENDEEDINLKIAYEIKRLLEKNGENVLLTRTTNTYVKDEEKIKLVNFWGADFFITLNINEKNDLQVQGTEIYINKKCRESEELANFIKLELISNLRTEDRGINDFKDLFLDILNKPSIIIRGEYLDQDDINIIAKKYGECISRGCLTMVNKVLIDIPNKRPKVPKREGWRICLGYYKEYEEAEAYIIKLSAMGLKDIYIVPYPEKIE